MSEYTKSSPEIISIPKISNEQIRNNLQYNLFPIINLNMLNPENLKYEIQYPNYNSLYINYLFQNFLLAQTNLKLQNEKKIKNEEVENVNNILLGKKKRRSGRLCTECPHKFSPHYAKGMCSNCYHSKGRSKKPWNCSHTNKTHYALGLCQNCYQMNYIKKQSECDNKKIISNVNQKNLLDLNNDKKENFEMEKKDFDCHIENIEEKKI